MFYNTALDRFFYAYFAFKLDGSGDYPLLVQQMFLKPFGKSLRTFAISVCSEFLSGITCAGRKKTNKIEIKVAVSGFIRWNFNNNY
jgi:hypothetical protein